MIAAGNAKVTTGVANRVARLLLENAAVQVNREKLFVYTSGIRSPIYCDLRVLIGSPSVRAQIVQSLIDKISEECDIAATDVIAGVATSGVPWAAWLADKLDKPMAYVRDAPKEHGKGLQVEGMASAGKSVILIEDHISTGGSALRAATALRDAGAKEVRCISIFTYESPRAGDDFQSAGVKLVSLCGINTLLKVGVASGRLTLDDDSSVRQWLERELMAPVS